MASELRTLSEINLFLHLNMGIPQWTEAVEYTDCTSTVG